MHAPIGLSIGAETPEEIAISIAAQLIQVRARFTSTIEMATERRVVTPVRSQTGGTMPDGLFAEAGGVACATQPASGTQAPYASGMSPRLMSRSVASRPVKVLTLPPYFSSRAYTPSSMPSNQKSP